MKENYREITCLALGDSYTIGESVDPSLRWPVQLVNKLRNESINMSDAVIIARTGWTTDEIDAFNRLISEECGNAGIKYFNITDISREASLDSSLVAADGLHPSGKMYGLWVDSG
ncbi:MAG TPA: hypothetical protein DEQ09_03100, partial [Bacteroidales bacterium]|nr:hypothetical protein [Bacteroidales bacterium]